MLTIRKKVVLMIIGIVLVITASSLGLGLFVSQYRFMQTVKETLRSVSKIASGLISGEVERLRGEALFSAERIRTSSNVQQTLYEQAELNRSYFLSFTVIGRDGSILRAGDAETWVAGRTRESEYGKRAFSGETLVTTTMHTPDGGLVMYIWTPVDTDRVLVIALPGLYLSDFITNYRIWDTGALFILDTEGVLIAASREREYRVLERHNYIDWGKRDPEYRKIGAVFKEIIETEAGGIEQYPLNGEQRLCAFERISGTDRWSIGVAAPLADTPMFHIRQIMFIFAAVFMSLGIIAALFAANSIASPYEEMANLRRRAEIASESKTKFLANMSHEMRTPLNAIIGLSELELGTGSLSQEDFNNMEKIYSAGMTLLGIINDLLDISKIESGNFILVPIIYDMPSVINDTINLNIVRIGSKPIQFRLHLKGSLPSRLKGDELRIKQVFNNLLSNAFKYTDSGFVDWTISSERQGGRVKITSSIRDTGKGIQKNDLENLFKDYYQANLHANYYVEGTGLGLSITHNLVKLMDGAITVTSDYGKGSEFIVEFYQEASGDEVIGEEVAENLTSFRYSAQRRSRNQKLVRADMSYAAVLVVDDVVTNLEVTQGMLKPYGITVECVTSGEEAVKRMREEKTRYNAIFMDQMMPGMDGIEAAKTIHHKIGTEYAKNIPIIALTANAMQGSDALFLENGFQAFLSKPIDILRLDQILNLWVRDKKQERGHVAAEESVSADLFKNVSIPGLNIAQGLARFEGDEETYLRILNAFVRHTPTQITVARKMEDMDSYRIAVHSIKGSSRGIGAETLGNEAEKLEVAAKQGDKAQIEANSALFLANVERMIAVISDFLAALPGKNKPKPEKNAPDANVCAVLREACKNFDITALNEAITSLDAYNYPLYPNLVEQLRQYASLSDFKEIQKKLEALEE